MIKYEDSYQGKLRQVAGNLRLILPSARAIILDDKNRVLLIRRTDNDKWALPSGSVEYNESVFDCLKREVKEETGFDVAEATPIAIYSEPRFISVNAHGNEHQMFAVVFLVKRWGGRLIQRTDETLGAAFFDLKELPNIPDHHLESIKDALSYDGNFILK